MPDTRTLWVIINAVLVVFIMYTLNNSLLQVVKRAHRQDNLTPVMSNDSSTQRKLHVLRRFIDRRVRVQDFCFKEPPSFPEVKSVTGNMAVNFSVCLVPETGSTTWARLFRFMIDKDNFCEKPILSYSQYDINHGYKTPYEQFEIYGKAGAFVKQSVRAMNVRNPYTRLWAAYIEKFFLPGFWKSKGTVIIQAVRPGATQKAKECGNDVTFQEFVRYVAAQGHSEVGSIYDSHWLPVADLCDLCRFRPQYIVDQETLMEDFEFVMETLRLLPVVDEWLAVDHDEFEVKTKIEIWFYHFTSVRECISLTNFVRRIWNALKLEGYLYPEAQLPKGFETVSHNATTVTSMVLDARSRQKVDRLMRQEFVHKTLKEVYTHIPSADLDALKSLYEFDFKLFGYDPDPPGSS